MSLVGEYNFSSIKNDLDDLFLTAERIFAVLLAEYTKHKLSSRDIVRPEASHPLVLLPFATLLLIKKRDINTVIGLPAGGTEIALLVTQALKERGVNRECDIVMLPVSLHSLRVKFGKQFDSNKILPIYWEKHKEVITGRNILIVDDNSSSGATIDTIYSSLYNFSNEDRIDVAVAEADINRTKLDLHNLEKRSHYADLSIYQYSVGILPISRGIWRKHDLKEVLEAYSIGLHYAKLAKQVDLVDKIKAETFKYETIRPFERLVAEPEWKNMEFIDSFKDTFLSNFYKINIPWRGKSFPSVEHAYQYAKFDPNVLSNMPTSLWQKVEALIGDHTSLSLKSIFVVYEVKGS